MSDLWQYAIILLIVLILVALILSITHKYNVVPLFIKGGNEFHTPIIAISAAPGIDIKKVGQSVVKKIKNYKHVHTDGEDIKIEKAKGFIITGQDLRDDKIPKPDIHIHLTYIPYSGPQNLYEYKKILIDEISRHARISETQALLKWEKYVEIMGKSSINTVLMFKDIGGSVDSIINEIDVIRAAWET